MLEESIKELDQEEEEKRKAAEALAASAAASEGSQDGEPEGTEVGGRRCFNSAQITKQIRGPVGKTREGGCHGNRAEALYIPFFTAVAVTGSSRHWK